MGSITTSRIVTCRGRVSMNTIVSATSLGSINEPVAGGLQTLGPQSASSALTTGPGETDPRMPCVNTCRRVVWTKQLIAHLLEA